MPWHLVYVLSASTPGTARGAPAERDGTAAELARSTTGPFPKNLTGKSARCKHSKTFAILTTSPAGCAKSFCLSPPSQQSGVTRERNDRELKVWSKQQIPQPSMAHSSATQALVQQVLFLMPLAGLKLRLWMHDQLVCGKYLCDLVGWSPHHVRRRPLGTHGLPFDMTICPSGRSQPLG